MSEAETDFEGRTYVDLTDESTYRYVATERRGPDGEGGTLTVWKYSEGRGFVSLAEVDRAEFAAAVADGAYEEVAGLPDDIVESVDDDALPSGAV